MLREHCAPARFVWNLAVEQQSWWRPGRGGAPGYLAQCRQLTAARRDNAWLAAGSQMVREADRRKDGAEKTSTTLARRFDMIRLEDLRVTSMTASARGTTADPGHMVAAKAGLNRQILANGWGRLARRLEDKAYGRVEKISPAFTSQRCSACGPVNREPRQRGRRAA